MILENGLKDQIQPGQKASVKNPLGMCYLVSAWKLNSELSMHIQKGVEYILPPSGQKIQNRSCGPTRLTIYF